MDEISVSSEGSRAAGCGLRSSLHMRGGGVSCPKRTEGPKTRPKGLTKRRLAMFELISGALWWPSLGASKGREDHESGGGGGGFLSGLFGR